jgi:hypothetical protein
MREEPQGPGCRASTRFERTELTGRLRAFALADPRPKLTNKPQPLFQFTATSVLEGFVRVFCCKNLPEMPTQVTAMAELIKLPASVLIHIISLLDNDSVKTLRLTCKELSGFANRVLFRSISLYDKHDSCGHLQSVIIQPHLREEVFKLNLHTVEEDYVSLSCY